MSSVDVIVPCYSYGHYLSQCVESVLVQAGCDVRVLVLDDASADDMVEVAGALASRDPRAHVMRHAINTRIATYNGGIEWACADYLLPLSADDNLLPGRAGPGRACALDPASRRSLHWGWLAWKRWLGTSAWQSMRPSAAPGHASVDRRKW